MSSQRPIRPLKKFAVASAKCAEAGAAYSSCILASAETMSKDRCRAEFEIFNKCVKQHVSANLDELKFVCLSRGPNWFLVEIVFFASSCILYAM